jgi:glycosyltransferase involved in cell wall biosynthesis
MRIALAAAADNVHTMRWANGLVARGLQVDLVTLHAPSAELDPRVAVHRLPLGPPWGYLANVPRLRRLLRRLRPDVLHAHYATGYATLARQSGFRPRVVSVWGADVYDFPDRAPWRRRLVVGNLTDADLLCSTSHVMARRVRRLAPALPPPEVIPFGVPTDVFVPRPDARPPGGGAVVVGTVKALTPKYGIDTLLRGFAACCATLRGRTAGRGLDLRLRIFGDGPEREALRRLAQQLGIDDRTEFRGRIPHGSVPQALRDMDVFVAASRHDSESFGVAVVEASSAGLPVVVTRAGGLPEVVADQVTGYVVDKEDCQSLGDRLARLAGDAALRRRLGENGRRSVQSQYEWTACVDRMIEAYRRVAARRVAA